MAEKKHDGLKLRDQLDDLMVGFEFWADRKQIDEWSTADEMLIRWVHENAREGE